MDIDQPDGADTDPRNPQETTEIPADLPDMNPATQQPEVELPHQPDER